MKKSKQRVLIDLWIRYGLRADRLGAEDKKEIEGKKNTAAGVLA